MTDHTPDMVLVPREPTEAMLDAYWHGEGESREMRLRIHERSKRFWSAMLSASPLGASGEGALRPASRSSVPTEGHGAAVVGWQPIETVEFRGQKIEVRHKDGSEFTLWANPEWRPEARRHYTHWRPAPSTTSTAEQVGMTTEGRNAPNPPGEGEAPVAWRVEIRKGVWSYFTGPAEPALYAGKEWWSRQPLYTRPTPATPEGLRDLKDEIFLYFADRGGVGQSMADLNPDDDQWSLEEHLLIRAHRFLAALQPQAQVREADEPNTPAVAIDRLRELATAATPGPWFKIEHTSDAWTIQDRPCGGGTPIAQNYADKGDQSHANAAFIAAANPAAILSLITAYESQAERPREAEGALERVAHVAREMVGVPVDTEAANAWAMALQAASDEARSALQSRPATENGK